MTIAIIYNDNEDDYWAIVIYLCLVFQQFFNLYKLVHEKELFSLIFFLYFTKKNSTTKMKNKTKFLENVFEYYVF